jgi:hypothetical protein
MSHIAAIQEFTEVGRDAAKSSMGLGLKQLSYFHTETMSARGFQKEVGSLRGHDLNEPLGVVDGVKDASLTILSSVSMHDSLEVSV